MEKTNLDKDSKTIVRENRRTDFLHFFPCRGNASLRWVFLRQPYLSTSFYNRYSLIERKTLRKPGVSLGKWIAQFYVMEDAGVGVTFNRIRLSTKRDIRFVAATFKLFLSCYYPFLNAVSTTLELGHKYIYHRKFTCFKRMSTNAHCSEVGRTTREFWNV